MTSDVTTGVVFNVIGCLPGGSVATTEIVMQNRSQEKCMLYYIQYRDIR